MSEWASTSCIICSINCGLKVRAEEGRIVAIRGDRDHPTSKGYLCEKARALDHYQNGADRITSPLRRREDGSFEEVDWETAIREVAGRLAAVRDAHGGESIFYYGGGAQGNHLGGVYGRVTRSVLGSVYTSNALAQEKTGEFWVDGQLFGRARCHTSPDFEHADVAVFVGKNPWQSHGFPRARVILKQIAKDPERTMIVIDPRRSETAAMADIHLQVRPGGDAWLLAALVAVLLEEDLIASRWLAEHANGLDELRSHLNGVDVAAYCKRAGVAEDLLRQAARAIGRGPRVSVLEDLGIQQAPHSTLSSWLEKLLYLLTGNFAKEGGMNIHSRFASLGGGSGARRATSPVGGHRIIAGLIPCNVIPDEILTDHPGRFRAMIVESGNPVHSLADSARMREALRALDFVVVIDVARTETAAEADYILPAASQFEKWEATFFNLEFPENFFHLRRPVTEPRAGTLAEPEIHSRLVRALGALDGLDLEPLRTAAAHSLEAYGQAFAQLMAEEPRLMRLAPVVLYETLAPALPEGGEGAAAIWGIAQQVARYYPESVRRAGFDEPEPLLGTALFRRVMESPSGAIFTVDPWEETWARVETGDGRIRLVVEPLLEELRGLETSEPTVDTDYPFVLAAGERRSDSANTLFRDPSWRKAGPGTLRLHPKDAARLGLGAGMLARVSTRRGSVLAPVELSDTLLPGHSSLPNGQGLAYPDDNGGVEIHGAAPNELTASEDRDWLAGTPWHKHVRAKIEAVAGESRTDEGSRP